MLLISKPYNIDDMIIDECGAIGGMKIGRGTEVFATLSITNPT
jgi:hypothetical protein